MGGGGLCRAAGVCNVQRSPRQSRRDVGILETKRLDSPLVTTRQLAQVSAEAR